VKSKRVQDVRELSVKKSFLGQQKKSHDDYQTIVNQMIIANNIEDKLDLNKKNHSPLIDSKS
jgi:hypothetical protein